MTFARIEMLFFIWSIPLLLLLFLYGMRRRKAILHRFATDHGLAAIAPEKVDGRRWTKAFLLMGAALFCSVALAGPQYGFRWQEIRQQGVDLIIALDCSRSMTAADIPPNRLERAKREVFDLLRMLQGDRVGLVAFAGTAFLQCPLTLDYPAFNLFLNTLHPDNLPVGGTDITAALETSRNAFEADRATEKAVILITDGENTGKGDPLKAAGQLKEKEIRLFCIGVGSGEGVPIPDPGGGFKKDGGGQIVLSRLDETTLQQMAVLTGGTYVRSVAGDMDLKAIYTDEIQNTMQAETLASGRKQIWENRFQWPLALALLCLAADLLLPITRKTAALVLFVLLSLAAVQPAEANSTKKGLSAFEQGEFEQALKQFTDAQLNDPDRPELLYNVGGAYYKTGNFDAAADHYERALTTNDRALKQKILYNLGNVEFRRGNHGKAIERYEAALAIDPEDKWAKENLAFVKKVAAQKQQRQSGGEKNSEETKDSAEKGDAEDGAGAQAEENQNKPSIKTAPSEPPEARPSPSPSSADSGKKAPKPETSPSAALKENPVDTGKQAERMLNRLEDQPGRALMPRTGKQPVAKDW